MLPKPGEVYDIKGVPIYPGDLIRSYHFTGRRRKVHYLYHVACLVDDHMREPGDILAGVPAQYLSSTVRRTGGIWWLRQDNLDAMRSEVLAGYGPHDKLCYSHTDRPRLKR